MRVILLLGAVLCPLYMVSVSVLAEERVSAETPSGVIHANELGYNDKDQTITATGKVDIKSEGQSLTADKVSYDQKRRLIRASGGVTFKDKDHNTYRAGQALFKDDFTQGTISDLSGEYKDFSKFSAKEATRENENLMVLEHTTYTPCDVCLEDKEIAPMWHLSAEKVVYDKLNQRMEYEDARFHVKGVPVLYTPYFAHAAPGAERKSGFLIPTYRNISTLGFAVTVPYYWNIRSDMDATIAPVFTSEEGIIMSGEFRHLLDNGYYELSGSVTHPKERDLNNRRSNEHELRGHFEGKGRFSFEDDWTLGFDGKRASDDTYLRRYKFGNEDLLTSEAFAEQMKGSNYVGVRGITFQGMNAEDDPDTTPLVLPYATAHYETSPMNWGSHMEFDANTLVIDRNTGVNSRRVSGTAGWVLPHTTVGGHRFELVTSLRGDLYHVENVLQPDASEKDGWIGRVIPEAKLSWKYPLINNLKGATIMVEPLADVILSPAGNNPAKIPNEDSQFLELTDINLFESNRYTGYDLVESGPRSNYGVRGFLDHHYGTLNYLLGQSYHATVDDTFPILSGLDDNFSDYVGRVGYGVDGTELVYRFRVDKDDFVVRRNEVGINLTLDRFYFGTSYILLNEDNNQLDRQEVSGSASVQIDDNWSAYSSGQRNLEDNGGWITAASGLVYEDECVRLTGEWSRDFTRFIDIEPNTTYMFRVGLKNLGK